MVSRLPDGYMHPWTLFSVANVAATAVSVQVDLRKSRSALDTIGGMDPDQLNSIRRGAGWGVQGSYADRAASPRRVPRSLGAAPSDPMSGQTAMTSHYSGTDIPACPF